jgi:hypothetical protein
MDGAQVAAVGRKEMFSILKYIADRNYVIKANEIALWSQLRAARDWPCIARLKRVGPLPRFADIDGVFDGI